MITAAAFRKSPPVQGAALTNSDCLSHAEIVGLVAAGELVWASSAPGLHEGHVYTVGNFTAYIRTHVAPAEPTGDLIDWGTMKLYRDLAPPTPLAFSARHDYEVMPVRQVTLTWSNGGVGKPKVLQWSPDQTLWYQIDTPSSAATSYVHGANGPIDGINYYRIRWSDSAEWASRSVLLMQ